jgi:hypothetical protein
VYITPSHANLVNDPDAPPRYYRDPVGRVYMEGRIEIAGEVPGGGLFGATLFTLAEGYRPPTTRYTMMPLASADGQAGGSFAVEFRPDGVVWLPYRISTGYIGQFINLDNLQFRSAVPEP